MKHIVVIGTEGSGKTVLLTVLAKRFGHHEPKRVFMNPTGKTLRFVEKNWNTLNEGQWPPSNTAGQKFIDLEWRCQTPSGEEMDLHAIDCAGQDLRRLFDDSPPEALAPLAEYVTSAQVVLFLINPSDFIGVGDKDQVIENHVAIKEAMDRLRQAGRRCALVFTQSDLHQNLVQKHGNWRNVARDIVPAVHGGHLAAGDVAVFSVSAVSDTEVANTDEGRAVRVPKPDFQSTGLDEVMNWIVTSASQAADVRQITQQLPQNTQIGVPPQIDPVPSTTGGSFAPLVWSIIAVIVLGFLLLTWLGKPCPACEGTGRRGYGILSVQCGKCKGTGKIGFFSK